MIWNTIELLASYALWGSTVAVGLALALAPAILPQFRLVPTRARRLVTCGGLGLMMFALGHIHGMEEQKPSIRSLQRDVTAARERAREQSELAQLRLTALAETLTQVDAYEEELANGQTTACPSDPAYDRRLRNILGGATQ